MGRGLTPGVSASAAAAAGTMRAAVFRTFGPPSVLQYEADFQRPVRRPGEVLVKVAAASINPIDWCAAVGDACTPRLWLRASCVRACAASSCSGRAMHPVRHRCCLGLQEDAQG